MNSLEGERDQRHSHDQQIEEVEGRPTEGAVVENEAVRDRL